MFLSDEAWLNWTNALLGIAAGVALLAICAAVFHDVLTKMRERARARRHFVFDQHSIHVPDLGLTMADGGEPLNGKPEKH
jgi:hypothetical protein